MNLTQQQIEQLDQYIPVKIRTYNSLTNYSFEAVFPEFNFTLYPALYQMNVTLLLQNLYNDSGLQIEPPEGINTIDILPVTLAEITTQNEQTVRVRIDTVVISPDAVAAGMDLYNGTGTVDFTDQNNYSILIRGQGLTSNQITSTGIN